MSAAGRPCRLRGAIATLGVAVTLAAAPAAGAERQAPTVTLAVAPEPARFAPA